MPLRRRLRVAFFSTGDELRSIGEPLDAGCVYDSNRYTMWGMLQRLGVDAIDLGVLRDDPAALEAAFRHAAENADAVITSGGVSVGEADHTKQVMRDLGEVLVALPVVLAAQVDGGVEHLNPEGAVAERPVPRLSREQAGELLARQQAHVDAATGATARALALRNRALLEVLYGSGLRRQEACEARHPGEMQHAPAAEMPAKMPSSRARRRHMSSASSWLT